MEEVLPWLGPEFSVGVIDVVQSATAAYEPGYLILDDHLIIATTSGALELAASINDGQEEPLAEESEYSRLVAEVSGTRSPLFYVNLRAIIEEAVAALDPATRKEYGRTWSRSWTSRRRPNSWTCPHSSR